MSIEDATVSRVVPQSDGLLAAADVLQALQLAPSPRPFDEQRCEFVHELSRVLSRRGRDSAEIQSLAFWLRRSQIVRMRDEFFESTPASVITVPRGIAFHIPPANVDTLFVYSWMLSLLSGNRDLIRLSSRSSGQAELIIDTVNEVLAKFPAVAEGVAVVRYGHDSEVTEQFSAACDVRVIWGGNNTIAQIRKASIAPHATEMAFGDRRSLALLSVRAYERLDSSARDQLAHDFFNDAYTFDQMGCSSPRLVVWVGTGSTAEVSRDFFSRVAERARTESYDVGASLAIAKIAQGMRTAIDYPVDNVERFGNECVVINVDNLVLPTGDFCGGGTFYQYSVPTLEDTITIADRTVQTASYFGFDQSSVRSLAIELNGRGIDRFVPVGGALQFGRRWDGYDLIANLTRQIGIS